MEMMALEFWILFGIIVVLGGGLLTLRRTVQGIQMAMTEHEEIHRVELAELRKGDKHRKTGGMK